MTTHDAKAEPAPREARPMTTTNLPDLRAVACEREGVARGHDCETCADCVHDGRKCCGCYDGACCQPTARETNPEPEEQQR